MPPLQLPFRAFRNEGLFSDHYLAEVLPRDPTLWSVPWLQDFRTELLALWRDQAPKVARYTEPQLEEHFIRPVLRLLGHVLEVQPKVGQQKPDYAFFLNEDSSAAALSASSDAEYWQHVIAVGEVKAWERKLDRAQAGGTDWDSRNPSFQVYHYLAQTGCKWAILTNGRHWRLYCRDPKPSMQTFYQVDLAALLEGNGDSGLVYFRRFFHRDAFEPGPDGQSFLDRSREESSRRAEELRDDVKGQVYHALLAACRGFLEHEPNGLTDEHLTEVYDNGLVLLYRLLFVLYAEAAERLPVGSNPEYQTRYSLLAIKNEIRGHPQAFASEVTALWHRLRDLFRVVDRGNRGMGVPEYNGGLFDPRRHPFLEQNELSERDVAEVVSRLAMTPGRDFIDYHDLGVRHLGSIYEGLLEYRLARAAEPMVVVRRNGKDLWVPEAQAGKAPPGAERCAAGDLYLATDRGERKATGSYYTPEFIVDRIVTETLGPLAEACPTPEDILALRVLDPAMGSGHFLVEATDFLAAKLVERGATPASLSTGAAGPEEPGALPAHADSDLARFKRLVVERCIYGVDVNPLAVELAKLSLWLDTVAPGEPLSFLDHHLRCGNSLIGAWIDDLAEMPHRRRKPPIRSADTPGEKSLFDRSEFARHANQLIFGLVEISRMLSDSRDAVQSKGRILQEIEDHHSRPYREVADLWCSRYFGNEYDAAGYSELVQRLQRRTSPPCPPLRAGEGGTGAGTQPAGAVARPPGHRVVGVAGAGKVAFAREQRREPTAAESVLWERLRGAQLGVRFRRQHPIGDFVLDFYCAEVLLAVEVDGPIHEAQAEYDQWRDERLAHEGIRVLRLRDEAVRADLEQAIAAIRSALVSSPSSAPPLVSCASSVPFLVSSPSPARRGGAEGGGEASPAACDALQRSRELVAQYLFFHWELEFPEVFFDEDGRRRETPGFDAVVGNPPWERMKLQENEFFALRDPRIALAPTAAKRKTLIQQLPETNPPVWQAYQEARDRAELELAWTRDSGQFPLMGRGDTNLYAVMAERARSLTASRGRIGLVVPSGIATDQTTKDFFGELIRTKTLCSLLDFENRKGIFPDVDSRFKFSIVVMTRSEPCEDIQSGFFLHGPEDLADPERVFLLRPEDCELMSPNTHTCPVFRTRRDADLTRSIYERVPVLVREAPDGEENPWGVRYLRMFDMANDSSLFRTAAEVEAEGFWRAEAHLLKRGPDEYVPLYEGKTFGMWNHRAADTLVDVTNTFRPLVPRYSTPEELADPAYFARPAYWVPRSEVDARLREWRRPWLAAFKDVTAATNQRTGIYGVLPRCGVGHTAPLCLFERTPPHLVSCFLASSNSLAQDYVLRQKIGAQHMTYFHLRQLPVLRPSRYEEPWHGISLAAFISSRVLELTYTAHDIAGFAEDMGYVDQEGNVKPPFPWDEERRLHLRCQLDALFFHLYGLTRDETDYVLETFPIVKRHDLRRFGRYRTKELVLHYYHAYAAGDMDAWVEG